ncbi:Pentapeptide repeat-containing protein [Bordetella sputigena]|uniref:pentapeptide repeat-containing protein n=1 Tax=Bordetella sputigena TaxID=1416810 RepID=UPI0039F09101
MQITLATFIPCCVSRPPDETDSIANLRDIECAIKSVAKSTGLSRAGREALLQWTGWGIYATAMSIQDPHLGNQPGWHIVLPYDQAAAKDNLHRFLQRAGELLPAALAATKAYYEHSLIPDNEDAFLDFDEPGPDFKALKTTLRTESGKERLRALPVKDLPRHAVPFDTLPAWAVETALFSTNLVGKDCHGMSLKGLDLRYLHAPGIDLEGADVTHTNFFEANLFGAHWANTKIRGTVMPIIR